MRWRKVTLVGVGLLGGSLGLALKKRGLAEFVVGFVRRAASISECRNVGAVDLATRDLSAAVSEAELVVLCTPIAQMRSLTLQMLPALRPGVIVTDVGSVKGSVVREIEPVVAAATGHFVGSHPMAGAEKNGVAWSRDDLFSKAICVVTPTRKTNRTALGRVEQLWRSVGAKVMRLSPDTHDEFVSHSSHLPHLVAAGLANLVLSPGRPKAQARLCANGFRDTTRIASGSPEMWRDIAVANRRRIGAALSVFIRDLQRLQRRIDKADARGLEAFLRSAKARRDAWQKLGAQPSPE